MRSEFQRRRFVVDGPEFFVHLMGLTAEERGFHISLLLDSCLNGPVPDEGKYLKTLLGVRRQTQLARVRDLLARKWDLSTEGWVCPWFEDQIKSRRTPLSHQVRQTVIERDESICGLCREPVHPSEEIHIDHIIPVALGGSDDLTNLQVAHAHCNLRKGARAEV